MTRNGYLQIFAAVALACAAVLLVNPAHLWMPSMTHELMLVSAAVAFAALSVFVLAEGRGDERDDAHRALAGRAAFLAGGGVLMLAVILEGLRGSPDPWLIAALVAMTAAKVLSRAWAATYR